MTFVAVASTPDWAIVAETLGSYNYDAASNRVTLLPGLGTKISLVAGGYVAGGGNRFIVELVTTHLAAAVTPAELLVHLQRARPAIDRALAGFRPAQAAYARSVPQMVWVGVWANDRPMTLVLDWVAGTVTDTTGEVRCIPPYGYDHAEIVRLLDDYSAALSGCRDGNALHRATGALFAAVRERYPDVVSAEFEIAGVTRTRTGWERWRNLGGGTRARASVPVDTTAETWLAGGATIASQGQIKWVPICVGDVVTLPGGKKGFQITQINAPRVFFHEGEVQWLQVTPGFSERVPEFYVPYNWNVAVQKFGYEHRAYNGPGLLNLGVGRVASQPSILDADTAQWLISDGTDPDTGNPSSSLAQRIAARQATLLGTGMMLWRFRTTYAYPELEVGDVVCVPTDRFVAMNPISGGGIVGRYTANAVIVETSADAQTFGVWVRQWSDLAPALQSVGVTGQLTVATITLYRFGRDTWDFTATTYATPFAADGFFYTNTAFLSRQDVPHGAHLSAITTHAYLGDASAGSGQYYSALFAVLNDGSGSIVIGSVASATETNSWVDLSGALDHIVDWDTYHYYVLVQLKATGIKENARFMWSSLTHE